MSRPVVKDNLMKVESDLTAKQVQKFFEKTPEDKIKVRPAKGGGEWKYVSGSYVTQVLNSLFGFDWSFTVLTSMADALKTANTGTVVVQGRLECRIGDKTIVKEQYGRKEVTYRKDGKTLLDFGNDLKAAATDAKKKCASELGLFADVYSQEDFFEAEVVDELERTTLDKISDAKTEEDLNAILADLSPEDKKTYASTIKHKLDEVRNGNSN